MATLSISLPEELSIRLRAACEKTGRNETDTVIEAVQQRLEDFEDISTADEALARVRAGLEPTWTLQEMEHELEMADNVL
jgi:RHH-type rel operon transcriptional repressor/antitoxin RelB